ncbi:MAG: PilZ domain-containing protein [Clostridium sp.]|nr:PilZ domain-containing protein [Clostridium sp.]
MDDFNYLFKISQSYKENHRRDKRVDFDSTFVITSVNSKTFNPNLKVLGLNVSISGISFKSDIKFKTHDILEIIFKYKNITTPATLIVKHVNIFDNGFYVGGKFIALPHTYWKILKDDLM